MGDIHPRRYTQVGDIHPRRYTLGSVTPTEVYLRVSNTHGGIPMVGGQHPEVHPWWEDNTLRYTLWYVHLRYTLWYGTPKVHPGGYVQGGRLPWWYVQGGRLPWWYMPGYTMVCIQPPYHGVYSSLPGIPHPPSSRVHEQQRRAAGYVRADGALGSDLRLIC